MEGPYHTERYVAETEENRNFDPNSWGVTPTSEIFMVVKVGSFSGAANCAPMEGRFEVDLGMPGQVSVVAGSTLTYIGTDPSDGYDIYHAVITRSWPNLWSADDDVMEKVIRQKVVHFVLRHDGLPVASKSFDVKMCDRVWGMEAAWHNYAYKRGVQPSGEREFSPSELLATAQALTDGAFKNIDPYKSHRIFLAHLVDYEQHPRLLEEFPQKDCLGKVCLNLAFTESLRYPAIRSNCSHRLIFLYDSERTSLAYERAFESEGSVPGYVSGLGGSTAVIDGQQGGELAEIHEAGHAHFSLSDEALNANSYFKSVSSRNCRYDARTYGIDGDHNVRGCKKSRSLYIPSKVSIMNYAPDKVAYFNRWGCIYGIMEITGSGLDTAAPRSRQMKCVHPEATCIPGATQYNEWCAACSDTLQLVEHRERPDGACETQPLASEQFGKCRGTECAPDASMQCLRDEDCKDDWVHNRACVTGPCVNFRCANLKDGQDCHVYNRNTDSHLFGACTATGCEVNAAWQCNSDSDCSNYRGFHRDCIRCNTHACEPKDGGSCFSGGSGKGICQAGRCNPLS